MIDSEERWKTSSTESVSTFSSTATEIPRPDSGVTVSNQNLATTHSLGKFYCSFEKDDISMNFITIETNFLCLKSC